MSNAMDVVGCQIIRDGKFLMLKRSESKSQPGRWGLPAGKMEIGETSIESVVREVQEETGIRMNLTEVQSITTIQYDLEEQKFIFHLFAYKTTGPVEIRISPIEHQDFGWFTLEEAAAHQDLMQGVDEILEALFVSAQKDK